jgi:hypothetical protein
VSLSGVRWRAFQPVGTGSGSLSFGRQIIELVERYHRTRQRTIHGATCALHLDCTRSGLLSCTGKAARHTPTWTFIVRAVEVNGDRLTIVHGAICRNWREAYDRTRRLASALQIEIASGHLSGPGRKFWKILNVAERNACFHCSPVINSDTHSAASHVILRA